MLTFGAIKASRIPGLLGMCATDARLAAVVNEAQERLLMKGMWWGCYQRILVNCDTLGRVTWPREVARVENALWCNLPVPVKNQWYEFLGPEWPYGEDRNEVVLQDYGTACTASDLSGLAGRKIRLDRGDASDSAKRVLLQGLDEDGEVIRTDDGAGTFYEGEWLTLNSAYVVSSSEFTVLTAVQKEATNAPVKVYEWDGASGIKIGEWAPSETAPDFRRSKIANFSGTVTQITAMVKREHLPVSQDNDWLVIQNLSALKEMCRSVLKAEHGAYDEASVLEAKAIALLRDELRHHTGDRVQISISGPGHGLRNVFAGFN